MKLWKSKMFCLHRPALLLQHPMGFFLLIMSCANHKGFQKANPSNMGLLTPTYKTLIYDFLANNKELNCLPINHIQSWETWIKQRPPEVKLVVVRREKKLFRGSVQMGLVHQLETANDNLFIYPAFRTTSWAAEFCKLWKLDLDGIPAARWKVAVSDALCISEPCWASRDKDPISTGMYDCRKAAIQGVLPSFGAEPKQCVRITARQGHLPGGTGGQKALEWALHTP